MDVTAPSCTTAAARATAAFPPYAATHFSTSARAPAEGGAARSAGPRRSGRRRPRDEGQGEYGREQ